jgi:antitoxin VapB
MSRKAKLFRYGRSQAVRLPADFRFEDSQQVFIRREPQTGDVILSRHPESWDSFFALVDEGGVPKDFMAKRGDQKPQKRELF